MASVPGALLIVINSLYARGGELWRAYREHYGVADDDVLALKAATREMNPTISQEVVDRAYAADAARASAEYGAEFRADIESFVSPDLVDAATALGCVELPSRARTWRTSPSRT